MDMFDRPWAITDVETLGLNFRIYDIVDFALLLIDPKTLELIHLMDFKVKPKLPEVFDPESVAINGYNEADWREADDLDSVMKLYSKLTEGAIFVSHNVTFDYGFVDEAFAKTGVPNLMDYHRLDLFSLAWAKKSSMPGLDKLNMWALCDHFGIPKEPSPHRAINGAMCELEVLKRLMAL